MVRTLLVFVLLMLVARAFWRLVGGILEGLAAGPRARVPPGGVPGRRVPMVRDPVCGTFVVPERAVSFHDGHERIHFCSTACRDAYRARTA